MTADTPSYKIDRFLQSYVLGANRHSGVVTQITLCMRGMLISGNLIGAAHYVRLMTDASPTEFGLTEFQDRFAELAEENLYIHLQNARIILESRPVFTAPLWRGRLDTVDGFFFELLGE